METHPFISSKPDKLVLTPPEASERGFDFAIAPLRQPIPPQKTFFSPIHNPTEKFEVGRKFPPGKPDLKSIFSLILDWSAAKFMQHRE